MKIPEHLRKPLLEQLEDQSESDDYLVMRGSALGYGLLGEDDRRDAFILKFLDTPEPALEGNELARELQSRASGTIMLEKDSDGLLARSKEIFEAQLEEALPDLPDDIEIDIAQHRLLAEFDRKVANLNQRIRVGRFPFCVGSLVLHWSYINLAPLGQRVI